MYQLPIILTIPKIVFNITPCFGLIIVIKEKFLRQRRRFIPGDSIIVSQAISRILSTNTLYLLITFKEKQFVNVL